MVTDRSHTDMAAGSLVEARNVVFDGSRVLKSPGSKKFNNATLDGAVVGLFDWFPDSITQRLIAVTRNGSVYRDEGNGEFNGNTPIKEELATPSDQTFFAEGGNELSGRDKKLFIFTGTNQIQVIQADGTSVREIDSPAVDWEESYPTAGVIHKGRLWVFGNPSAPHRLYASNSEDHEDFTSAELLTFEVFPGDGTRINAFIVYNERLFIFKDGQGAYVLDDTDPDIANWRINKLKSSFGCASPHSIVQALDDVLLKNETGSITSLAASDKFGNVESADALSALRSEGYMRTNTTRDGNKFTHSIYYP
ncbi:MAG: hypothetical protein ACXADS_15115, partial [Candidatus Thorarchaeota archaeon]